MTLEDISVCCVTSLLSPTQYTETYSERHQLYSHMNAIEPGTIHHKDGSTVYHIVLNTKKKKSLVKSSKQNDGGVLRCSVK